MAPGRGTKDHFPSGPYKEFTPRGQDQYRGFYLYQDFAQPSHAGSAGWHCCTGCHWGAPPAGACGDCRASSARGQILPARRKNHLLWQPREKSTHFSLKCWKCDRADLRRAPLVVELGWRIRQLRLCSQPNWLLLAMLQVGRPSRISFKESSCMGDMEKS